MATLNAIFSYIWSLPWWGMLLVVAGAFYGAGLLLTVLARTGEMLLAQLADWADEFAYWLSRHLSAAAIAALRAFGKALAVLFGYLFWPVIWLWRAGSDWLSGILTWLHDRLKEDKKLRALWKEEFRDQFKTFKEFKEAFHRGFGPQSDDRREPHFGDSPFEKPPDPPDPFVQACKVLGLPVDGGFSENDLDRKYRRFMSFAHQDKDGSHELATMINTSRDLIKQQKGWA